MTFHNDIKARNAEILAEARKGQDTAKSLAKKFFLSVNSIYKICIAGDFHIARSMFDKRKEFHGTAKIRHRGDAATLYLPASYLYGSKLNKCESVKIDVEDGRIVITKGDE